MDRSGVTSLCSTKRNLAFAIFFSTAPRESSCEMELSIAADVERPEYPVAEREWNRELARIILGRSTDRRCCSPRLTAGDVPPTLPITEAIWTVKFAQTAVAEGTQVLLPRFGEFPHDAILWRKRQSAFHIPANATGLGRIRRLEHDNVPFESFVVGVEFTEVQIQGIRYRFHAELASIQKIAGVEQALTTSTTTPLGTGTSTHSEMYTLPKLAGAATFFYRGSQLNLPKGFRTTWTTLTAP